MSSRRAFLAAPLGLLAGCGFQPVYAPGGGTNASAGGGIAQNDPSLRRALAAVRVSIIPERNGQILRRTLQRRFEGLEPGIQGRYELDVFLSYATEVLGYRTDGLATRVRIVATVNWALATLAIPREVFERGSARTIDAYNLPDLQFFAADASREDMERRIVAELSDRVVLGVAVALRQRIAATPAA
ncbi:MAG: LPS assembly lipoprotein LptE [Roseococcus sp.]